METIRLDPAVARVYELAKSIAPGNISVLIVGETGSGKERLAETIHQESRRSSKPFWRLNCAALSETLLESELFGHERGAFTGAVQTKQGLLEVAEGGSVFLDELGEMPLSLQAKLLRVIEDRKVTRVGGLKSISIDIRFISATNRDLEEEIQRRSFRNDLYYRLNGVTLALPPLRERRSEIEPLARLFLANASRENGRDPTPTISPEALDWLLNHHWPGNIRELRNTMERAALICEGDEVTLDEVRPAGTLRPPQSGSRLIPEISRSDLEGVDGGSHGHHHSAASRERARVVEALERCVWNQTRAAKLLGVSRGTLVARISEYQLPRPRKRSG